MPAIKIKINPGNHIETKKSLLTAGLNISDMARRLAKISDAQFSSIRTALTELLYGKRFHPTLAALVEQEFNLHIERPKHLQPIRQVLRQVA